MVSNITEIHEIADLLLEEAYTGNNSTRQCLLFYLSDNEDKIQKILLDMSDSPLDIKEVKEMTNFIKGLEDNWKKQDLRLVELGFISQIEALDIRGISKEDQELIQKQKAASKREDNSIARNSPEGREIQKVVKKYGASKEILFYVENMFESRPKVYKGLIIDKTQVKEDGSMVKVGLEIADLEELPDKVKGIGDNLNNFLFNIFSK